MFLYTIHIYTKLKIFRSTSKVFHAYYKIQLLVVTIILRKGTIVLQKCQIPKTTYCCGSNRYKNIF